MNIKEVNRMNAPIKFLSFFLVTFFIHGTLDAQNDTLEAKKDTGKGSLSSFEISLGFENYSARSSFAGGNYTYLQFFSRLNEHSSIFLKYSTNLTPGTFDRSIISSGVRGVGPIYGESDTRSWASILYKRDLQTQKDHVGVRFCLLGYQDQDMTMGLFPITLTYCLCGDDKLGLTYEWFSIGARF